MSRFHRSGHTRTNSQGTTFWVRGHDVNRDVWEHTIVSQQTISFGQKTAYGITYPNAKCPVCSDPVFFFQAYNGGRVFFDPPLGPPWKKHHCTSREPERANSVEVETSVNVDDFDTSRNNATYTYSLLPRPKGTIVEIYGEDDTITYITPLKLNQRLLDHVWPVKGDDGKLVGLSFLSVDFEPVEVPVRLRREASPLTLRIRRELSLMASEKLEGVVQRINGVKGKLWLGETEFGTFGIVEAEASKIFLIPVPANHRIYPDNDEIESLQQYMAVAADAAIEMSMSVHPTPTNGLFVNLIIYVFDDVIGHISDNMESELGFENGIFSSLWMSNPLEELRARLIWVDTFDDTIIQLPDCSLTLEEAFEDEAEFCATVWPEGIEGRRLKIQNMIGALGFTKLFEIVTYELKRLGWLMNFTNEHYGKFTHEIEYLQPDKDPHDDDAVKIRFLLSRSDNENGLAMAIGHLSDCTRLKDVLFTVRGSEDLEALVVKLQTFAVPLKAIPKKKKRQKLSNNGM